MCPHAHCQTHGPQGPQGLQLPHRQHPPPPHLHSQNDHKGVYGGATKIDPLERAIHSHLKSALKGMPASSRVQDQPFIMTQAVVIAVQQGERHHGLVAWDCLKINLILRLQVKAPKPNPTMPVSVNAQSVIQDVDDWSGLNIKQVSERHVEQEQNKVKHLYMKGIHVF